ncbi:glucose-1-phosphate thymidylyltransferase RfbA [Coralliovum pocilloporae]|uniref:glucose-1-phosphate thymidylyltransferase RfbA n=1 Tax=Coralliovum pocilloporae TaxID=3066369 RepID=UPI00330780B2
MSRIVIRKAIILAGGHGTRLQPLTNVVCKQLLPVYDKPMIHYPLSTLMLLGIEEILIISTEKDTPSLQNILGDGSDLGISISYAVQDEPRGLADAFIVGAEFVNGDPVALMLGDNLLYWGNLNAEWQRCLSVENGAFIVGTRTREPERFGIIETDETGSILSLEEKPARPKSNIAAIGLYFYDERVCDFARDLKPSARGELEITDLNNLYLEEQSLQALILSRGASWIDLGTVDSLMKASNFVSIVEQQQGLKIGCIEEVAHHCGYIDDEQLLRLAAKYAKSPYGAYLTGLIA